MRKKYQSRPAQDSATQRTSWDRTSEGFPSFQQDFITMNDWNCGHTESGQLDTDVATQERSTV